jgi:ketosteroid isomerase-like protein
LVSTENEWMATAKDPAKFVSYYAADAAMYPTGMAIVSGKDAIQKTYAEMAKTPGFALSSHGNKAEVSGDIGVTTGTYELTMGGVTEKGKYVTTWRKQSDGSWKVTNDIFNPDAMPGPPKDAHATLSSATAAKWIDAPPGLPPGGKVAIVSGDPTKSVPYVLRAQMPANYRIPPHWHPTTENLTVLSGTIAIGMGDSFDESKMESVSAGGFTNAPAEMHHFFMAKTAATIQIHGIGPFAITYVNAADEPRNKKSN